VSGGARRCAGEVHSVEIVQKDIAIYTKAGTRVFQQDLSNSSRRSATGNALSEPRSRLRRTSRPFPGRRSRPQHLVLRYRQRRRLHVCSLGQFRPDSGHDGDGKAFTEMHSINMTENVAAGTVFADYPRIGWNSERLLCHLQYVHDRFFNTYDHVSVISIDKTAATDWNNATADIHTHKRPRPASRMARSRRRPCTGPPPLSPAVRSQSISSRKSWTPMATRQQCSHGGDGDQPL